MNDLPITFLAWLAGFIDGEGCFDVRSLKGRKKHSTNRYAISLIIANTNKDCLEYIRDGLGCGSLHQLHTKTQGNRKPSYQYQLTGAKAQDVARAIYPYLQIKQAQARLFVTFPVGTVRSGQSASKETIETHAAIFEAMKELNRKGL